MKIWDRPPEGPSDQNERRGSQPEFPGRRSFLVALIGIGTVFVGALLSIPLVVFAFDPLFRKTTRTSWSDAGPESQFDTLTAPAEPVVAVQRSDGWRLITSRKPVYVLPRGTAPHRVLSPVCPHLGCEVEWLDQQHHFYCPCHASVFARDGRLVSGPAPRGMDYLESHVENDKLMVRYQYFRLLVSDREIIG